MEPRPGLGDHSNPQARLYVPLRVPLTRRFLPARPAANVPIAIGVLVAAGLTGVLVSNFAYSQNWLLLAEVAAAGLGFAFVLRWRWGVFGILLYIPLAGLVENLLYPASVALLLKFGLIGATYLGLLVALARRQAAWHVPHRFVAAALLLTAVCLVESFNPELASPSIALIGLGVLLFNIPLFIIGVTLAQRSPTFLDRLVWVVLVTSLPVCIFGIWEWFIGPSAVSGLSPALARTIWVIGPEATASFIYRPASTFGFIGQFGEYLIFVTLVAFGALHAAGRARTIIPLAVIFGSAAVSVILSAGRTAWFELPLAAVAMYLIRGRQGGFPRALPFIAIGVAIAFVIGQPVLDDRLPLLGNVAYLADHISVINPFRAELLSAEALIGHGTGSALGAIRLVNGGAVPMKFESGWTIPIYMLGLMGLVAYVYLYAVVLRLTWSGLQSLASDRRWLGAAIFCYLLVIVAVDGAINYPPTNVFFWLFAGLLAGQATRHKFPADESPSSSVARKALIMPSGG